MRAPINRGDKNRANIAEVKYLYVTGAITREEAKVRAQPILDRINEATAIKTKELNKKYGLNRKPVFLDFINAMRNSY